MLSSFGRVLPAGWTGRVPLCPGSRGASSGCPAPYFRVHATRCPTQRASAVNILSSHEHAHHPSAVEPWSIRLAWNSCIAVGFRVFVEMLNSTTPSGVNSFPPFVRCSGARSGHSLLFLFSHMSCTGRLMVDAVCAVGRSFQESGFPRSHHAQHDTVGLSSLSGRPCCCILCFMNLVRSMCSAACNGFSTRCAIVAWKSC